MLFDKEQIPFNLMVPLQAVTKHVPVLGAKKCLQSYSNCYIPYCKIFFYLFWKRNPKSHLFAFTSPKIEKS